MTKICILLLCIAVAFPLPPANAQETTSNTTTTEANYTVPKPDPLPKVELEGLYWWPSLSGHVFVKDDNQTTDVNFKSDLGLSDAHGIPGGLLTVHLGPESSIRATYLYLDDDGNSNLSRSIVYDGQTYPANAYVDSKMQVQYFSLGWLWNFIDEKNFNLGLVADVKGISARSSLDAPAYGFSNSQRFTGVAPTPGLSTQYKVISHLSIFGEISGLPAGHYGHFFDAQGGLKWNITRDLALSGGYRIIDVKVDYRDDSGDLDLPGPFAALTLQF